MREFETGATRDTDVNKPDYEGFLNPLVIESFGEYMNKHRVQADGTIRDSDNWQKGMPVEVYMKSMLRHVIDVWKKHRTGNYHYPELLDALNAVLFNTQGMMLEIIKEQECPSSKVFIVPSGDEPAVSIVEEDKPCTCKIGPGGICDNACNQPR